MHGKTRAECLMRLRRALDEMVVDGIETTLPLFRALVREPDIIDGDYHIHWLEQYLAGQPLERPDLSQSIRNLRRRMEPMRFRSHAFGCNGGCSRGACSVCS